MPDRHQDEPDQDEPDRETDPQTHDAEAPPEAQRVANGQTDKPVASKIAQHRRPCVAETPEDACRHTLETVEQLEDGGY